MKDLQISYFKKILAQCKERNIQTYVVMLPVRDNELKSYTDEYLDSFKKMLNINLQNYGFEGCYYDFSNDADFKDYKKYTDITHLNSHAADDFTKKMWNEISKN